MKHLKSFAEMSEELTIDNSQTYENPIFKLKFKSLTDLSIKKGSDLISKPINDLLDGINIGDIISGKGIADKEQHEGPVTSIKKDNDGENKSILIEEDGVIIELYPGSVKIVNSINKDDYTDPINTNPPPEED